MAADIQKGVYLALAVAHHQDGVLAHIGGEEVARLWYLALVAQKQPATREDALQLLLVDLRLDEDAAANQPALGIDQTGDVYPHWTLPMQRQFVTSAQLSASMSRAQRR